MYMNYNVILVSTINYKLILIFMFVVIHIDCSLANLTLFVGMYVSIVCNTYLLYPFIATVSLYAYFTMLFNVYHLFILSRVVIFNIDVLLSICSFQI